MSIASQLSTKFRNVVNRIARPSVVTRAQHEAVRRHPTCAACGSILGLQGHHVEPYKKFPELAADPSNFIVLCENVGGLECHLHVGHGGDFKFYNPDVVADAAYFRGANDVARRVLLDRIRAKRRVDA